MNLRERDSVSSWGHEGNLKEELAFGDVEGEQKTCI
jgi:hypothetical protein